MNDPTFLANLYSQGLLSDDMKNKIEDMDTETAKASYFLDHAIKPRLTMTDENVFEKLIALIKDYECEEVPNDVNEDLRRTPEPVPYKGNYVHCYHLVRNFSVCVCVSECECAHCVVHILSSIVL